MPPPTAPAAFMSDLPPSAAPTGGESAVGNLTSLDGGQILLPAFVTENADGVWISPRQAGSAGVVRQFIERVFGADAYLAGLDYRAMCELLYPTTATGDAAPPLPAEARRLAAAIRRFPPERQALYKNVKIADGGEHAEYIFEPVAIERVVETPIYGEADAGGQPVITGYERETQLEPARLDPDEFIAAMWRKGLCHGLDIAAVTAAIAATGTQRAEIARRTLASDGSDATLAEQTDALHRDDSPRILPSGKIDLHQFKNRFPQITANERLLKKVPRRFGKLGFELDGAPIEPPVPRDFDIAELSGPGTRVERLADGEYVVAAADGFLNIDIQSHQISVTPKIVNREGISLRTTGDLSLAGAEFEEHGEVQERRVVEGRDMTFHADVFGEIHSRGGRVHLLTRISGGRIRNAGGSVQIDQRAAQASIEARGGEVNITQAENSVIIADRIRIGRAMACDIVGDDIEIDEAVACTVAGRRIRIGRAGARRDVDCMVSLCVPDFAALDKARAAAQQDVTRLTAETATAVQKIEALQTPELRAYLATEAKLRAGGARLTDAQQAQWRTVTQRLAKPLQEVRALRERIDRAGANLAETRAELVALDEQRRTAAANLRVGIDDITSEVAVRTIKVAPGAPLFPTLIPGEARHKLRDSRDTAERLFNGAAGGFSWEFAAPGTAPEGAT